MIRSSAIRATAKQYQELQITVNTFRNKYGGLPGDLLAAKAAAFSLCPSVGCMSGASGYGDGNGEISGSREMLAAWNQLYYAGLIAGSFGSAVISDSNFTIPTILGDSPNMGTYFLPSKMAGTPYWVMAGTSENYYYLGGIHNISMNIIIWSNARSLTPTEAFQLDSKLDDGRPLTGKIQSMGAYYPWLGDPAVWSTAIASSAVAGDCVTGGASVNDTANIYATTASASANSKACILELDF